MESTLLSRHPLVDGLCRPCHTRVAARSTQHIPATILPWLIHGIHLNSISRPAACSPALLRCPSLSLRRRLGQKLSTLSRSHSFSARVVSRVLSCPAHSATRPGALVEAPLLLIRVRRLWASLSTLPRQSSSLAASRSVRHPACRSSRSNLPRMRCRRAPYRHHLWLQKLFEPRKAARRGSARRVARSRSTARTRTVSTR